MLRIRAGLGWAALCLVLSSSVCLASPSLREVLTPEEFQRAGLAKLTPEELAFLSARLLGPQTSANSRQPAGTAPLATGVAAKTDRSAPADAVPAEDTFGRELQIAEQVVARGPKEVQSRIQGKFEGWSGRTRFVLENGQVWQQTDPGEFVVNLASPAVTVRRGAFGAYYLRVAGYGAQVKVKRLK